MTEEHKMKISLAQKGRKLTEEHKDKLRKTGTQYKKGNIPYVKIYGNIKVREDKNNCWKGGTCRGYASRVLKESGRDLSKCQICKKEGSIGKAGKLVVHHLNGDRNNNKLRNLSVVCYNCHNTIHK